MRMSIKDCIEYMESEYRCIKDDDMVMEEDIKAYEMTLNIMRKYQKIEKILKGNFAYKLDLIEKVVKDGNIN